MQNTKLCAVLCCMFVVCCDSMLVDNNNNNNNNNNIQATTTTTTNSVPTVSTTKHQSRVSLVYDREMETFMRDWKPTQSVYESLRQQQQQQPNTPKKNHDNLIGEPETKVTFVTATYPKDLCKFRLQCFNILRYNNNNIIKEFVVMWLDNSPPPADFDAIKSDMTKQGITFTTLLMKDVVPKADEVKEGWLIQQVAKLRVANFINSRTYIVLDSKNIPTRPMKLTDFQNDKRTFVYSEYTYAKLEGLHRKWYLRTHETIHAVWQDEAPVGLSITPLIFHTQAVKEMIHDVEQETNLTLEYMICQGLVTEICLYNTWIRREGLVGQIHDVAPFQELSRVVWRHMYPPDVIREQTSSPALFFGVHREWQRRLEDKDRADNVRRVRELLHITPDMTWVTAACFE